MAGNLAGSGLDATLGLRARVGDYSVARAEANARSLQAGGKIQPEDSVAISGEGWARLKQAKEKRYQGKLLLTALDKALGYKQKNLVTGRLEEPKFDQKLLNEYAGFRLGNYLEENGYVIESLRVTA